MKKFKAGNIISHIYLIILTFISISRWYGLSYPP